MDIVGTPFVNFQVILQYVGRPALWPPWPCAAAESPRGRIPPMTRLAAQSVGAHSICARGSLPCRKRARADMESAPTIISIVQAFKRYSTVEYIRLVKRGQAERLDKHLWQRSFHDHVIRNETDYRMIAEYIQSNPRLWHKDCFYEEPSHEP